MKKFKAFTLVETLIVIIVFCIGILAVLHWLSQTLRNKDYANTQIRSAFFAREWIELMFNLRDANYHKELPWNCIFNRVENLKTSYNEDENPYCKDVFEPLNVLKISIWSENEYIHTELSELKNNFDEDFENFQIYFHTWNVIEGDAGFIYNYGWNEDEKTGFARYLLIKWVVDENEKFLDSDKILKIESHVLYKKWALTWEKVMETFIGNYEFNQNVLF